MNRERQRERQTERGRDRERQRERHPSSGGRADCQADSLPGRRMSRAACAGIEGAPAASLRLYRAIRVARCVSLRLPLPLSFFLSLFRALSLSLSPSFYPSRTMRLHTPCTLSESRSLYARCRERKSCCWALYAPRRTGRRRDLDMLESSLEGCSPARRSVSASAWGEVLHGEKCCTWTELERSPAYAGEKSCRELGARHSVSASAPARSLVAPSQQSASVISLSLIARYGSYGTKSPKDPMIGNWFLKSIFGPFRMG
jgi:hypothetical protein